MKKNFHKWETEFTGKGIIKINNTMLMNSHASDSDSLYYYLY